MTQTLAHPSGTAGDHPDRVHAEPADNGNRYDVILLATGGLIGYAARQLPFGWWAYNAANQPVGDPDGYLEPRFAVASVVSAHRDPTGRGMRP